MSAVIAVPAELAAVVSRAFGATESETMAIAFAGRLVSETTVGLVVHEVEIVPEDGYRRRGFGHIGLESRFVAETCLRALEKNSSLVFLHSHPGAWPPTFSDLDERTHTELIASFTRQIAGPIGSLVWSRGGWSGKVWREPGSGEEARIRLVGASLEIHTPSAGVHGEPVDPVFERQVRAFGPALQRALRDVTVGVVGLGGTGSLIAQTLAHVGVRRYRLIDDDTVEPSNRSRIVGATSADDGLAKVDVAARMVERVARTSEVIAYRGDVTRCATASMLRDCDLLIGCTDSNASRLLLNDVAYQYAMPLLDMGTLLRVEGERVRAAFSDVRMAGPGRACLLCLGLIDLEAANRELRPAEVAEQYVKRGYVTGGDAGPAPAVLPLNAVTAGLAVLRLFDLFTPWLSWEARITLEMRDLQVVERSPQSRADCHVCGPNATPGRGDDIPMRCVPELR